MYLILKGGVVYLHSHSKVIEQKLCLRIYDINTPEIHKECVHDTVDVHRLQITVCIGRSTAAIMLLYRYFHRSNNPKNAKHQWHSNVTFVIMNPASGY